MLNNSSFVVLKVGTALSNASMYSIGPSAVPTNSRLVIVDARPVHQ